MLTVNNTTKQNRFWSVLKSTRSLKNLVQVQNYALLDYTQPPVLNVVSINVYYKLLKVSLN